MRRYPLLVICVAASTLFACGEPIEFQNAGSLHTVSQDEAACLEELSAAPSSPPPAVPQIDPLQACMERKGWTRIR